MDQSATNPLGTKIDLWKATIPVKLSVLLEQISENGSPDFDSFSVENISIILYQLEISITNL